MKFTVMKKLPRYFAISAVLLANHATAAITIYSSESAFVLATAPSQFESFESSAARTRGSSIINTTHFSILPVSGLVGIQDGVDSPESGFGAFATDGNRYLFSYVPSSNPGSLVFTFTAPVVAFGFTMIDLGEAASTISALTGVGETASPVLLGTYENLANGNVGFIGFQQDTPFTELTLAFTGLDEAFGIDAVRVAVPEPTSLLGLMTSLVIFASRRRR
jgi:PEP-CTERM motif